MARLTEYDVRTIVREELHGRPEVEALLRQANPEAARIYDIVCTKPYRAGVGLVIDVLEAQKKYNEKENN